MEIKTKYNLEDEVYTLNKNKVIKVKIKAVKCSLYNTEKWINYITDTVEGPYQPDLVFEEGELFKTKEELLKSL